MFENLIGDIIGVGVLLYMAFAIYMKRTEKTLSETIKELREAFQ